MYSRQIEIHHPTRTECVQELTGRLRQARFESIVNGNVSNLEFQARDFVARERSDLRAEIQPSRPVFRSNVTQDNLLRIDVDRSPDLVQWEGQNDIAELAAAHFRQHLILQRILSVRPFQTAVQITIAFQTKWPWNRITDGRNL